MVAALGAFHGAMMENLAIGFPVTENGNTNIGYLGELGSMYIGKKSKIMTEIFSLWVLNSMWFLADKTFKSFNRKI